MKQSKSDPLTKNQVAQPPLKTTNGKQKLLLASATSAVAATLLAGSIVSFASEQSHGSGIGRGMAAASFLGLLSVALFFVGAAYPNDNH
jgi:hypothetical protein